MNSCLLVTPCSSWIPCQAMYKDDAMRSTAASADFSVELKEALTQQQSLWGRMVHVEPSHRALDSRLDSNQQAVLCHSRSLSLHILLCSLPCLGNLRDPSSHPPELLFSLI